MFSLHFMRTMSKTVAPMRCVLSAAHMLIPTARLLRLRLDHQGHLLAVRLSRSSGHSMLDDAALSSVRGMSDLPAPPDSIPWDDSQELPLPVTYRLN